MSVDAELKQIMDPARQAEERAFTVRLAKVTAATIVVAAIGHLLVDITVAPDYIAAATDLSFFDFVEKLAEQSPVVRGFYQIAVYGGGLTGAILGLITTRTSGHTR